MNSSGCNRSSAPVGGRAFRPPAGPVLQQWEDGSRRVIATGGVCSRGWWMEWDDLATFVFDQEGDVFVRAARPGISPWSACGSQKAVLPIVMVARGYEAFHASAVRVPSGVIGFLGLSGTGKSTTAEALTRLGLDHYADDTLVDHLVGDRSAVRELSRRDTRCRSNRWLRFSVGRSE